MPHDHPELLSFLSAQREHIPLHDAIQEIIAYIRSDPQKTYNVMVGTDSERHGNTVDFVTVIAAHRVGFGGRYFYRHFTYTGRYPDLRSRIWEEVNTSLALAGYALRALQSIENGFHFELHVDVGPNGATKTMLQEVINTVRAMGYAVKVKPESFAASTLADHHV